MFLQTTDTAKSFTSGGGGEGGAVITANKDDRRVTPLRVFKEIGHNFQLICGDQTLLFFTGSRTISVCDCGDPNGYFKPNDDAFITVTKWVFCALTERK